MNQSFQTPRDRIEPSGSQVATRASRVERTRQPTVHSQAQGTSSQSASKLPQLALAYLTTEYPKTSHTFIRREILELERSGQTVMRLAIRESDSPAVDPADIAEYERTTHLLGEGWFKLLLSTAITAVSRPRAFLGAIAKTLGMARRSDRGVLRHFAYLVEASHLVRLTRRFRIRHVHVHFGTNAAAVARLARCLGGPTYSLTIHGPDEFDGPQALSLPAKFADALFIVAITDYCAAQIRRWMPYEQWQKIHIVHCTIDESFLDEAQPVDPASRTFVCVGRLTAQKGQFIGHPS